MKDDGVQFKYSMKVMRVFYFKDTEQDGLRQIRINMKKADGQYEADNTFYDTLLVVCGKEPQLQGLQLDLMQIKYDGRGILTDQQMTTSQLHVYAVGDCVATEHASTSSCFERDSSLT